MYLVIFYPLLVFGFIDKGYRCALEVAGLDSVSPILQFAGKRSFAGQHIGVAFPLLVARQLSRGFAAFTVVADTLGLGQYLDVLACLVALTWHWICPS